MKTTLATLAYSATSHQCCESATTRELTECCSKRPPIQVAHRCLDYALQPDVGRGNPADRRDDRAEGRHLVAADESGTGSVGTRFAWRATERFESGAAPGIPDVADEVEHSHRFFRARSRVTRERTHPPGRVLQRVAIHESRHPEDPRGFSESMPSSVTGCTRCSRACEIPFHNHQRR